MQAFINGENKAAHRKKRVEIDPKETAAFLNRPVKKPEDLNQSLRKSYKKNFFNGPRFEDFKTLQKMRKKREENDSIASQQGEDEDYEQSQQKKKERPSPQGRVTKKEAKASKQLSKQMKVQRDSSSSFNSSEPIPTSKANKKMAKRPPKMIMASVSSSSPSSSSSSSKSSSNSEVAKQRTDRDSTRQEGADRVAIAADEKLDSATKDEAANKPEVHPTKQQLEIGSKQMTDSSSQLSDEPEPVLHLTRKAKLTNYIDKIATNQHKTSTQSQSSLQSPPSVQRQDSLVSPAIKMEKVVQDKNTISYEQTRQRQRQCNISSDLQTDSLPAAKTTRSSRLGIHSKVIVQSIYLSSSHSNRQSVVDLAKQWEQLNTIFLHAPCCPFSHQTANIKKATSEKDQPQSQVEKDDIFKTNQVKSPPKKQASIQLGKDQVRQKESTFRKRKGNSRGDERSKQSRK